MRQHRIFALVYVLLLSAGICAAQEVQADGRHVVLSNADRNSVVYVADFAIEQTSLKQDRGGIIPGPPGWLPTLFRRKKQDPAKEAEKLSALMSKSLVAELAKAGINAQLLSASSPEANDGLLVTGAFSIVDEGNQARRAMVGFGSGASKMEVSVMVSHLADPARPPYRMYAQANSGKKPGPLITPVPVAAFVKLAATKNAPEKTVKKLARQIAAELNQQLNGQAGAAAD